jgi:fructokinase
VKAALARSATVTIDPNVRPSLINDFVQFVRQLDQALDLVHLVKVSIEDLMTIDRQWPIKQLPEAEQEAIVAKYVENFLSRPNCELVVVTFGEGGSRAFTRAGTARAGIYSPPVFGDTVGAGDSLMAGILTILEEQGDLRPGRLRQLDQAALEKVLRFGAVVAGLNCAHKGCVPPTRTEVDAVLGATV